MAFQNQGVQAKHETVGGPGLGLRIVGSPHGPGRVLDCVGRTMRAEKGHDTSNKMGQLGNAQSERRERQGTQLLAAWAFKFGEVQVSAVLCTPPKRSDHPLC